MKHHTATDDHLRFQKRCLIPMATAAFRVLRTIGVRHLVLNIDAVAVYPICLAWIAYHCALGWGEARLIAADEARQPPNIVIILADDLGWADLACYGNRFNESPHLDRLAAQGVRFNQFYAGPVCSPTRANLQSGQDQARFGITQHIPGHRRPFAKLIDPIVAEQLPLSVETFAESLAAVGYSTGYFGKWHLGGERYGPAEQGWQQAIEVIVLFSFKYRTLPSTFR